MPKLSELIRIRDDVVFGGAVQVDWFYQEKAEVIAENFIFHGPEFFGVTEEDIEFSDHMLMDTCTYVKHISEKLYSDNGNPIMLTIAGYGTGKSHLAVTIGKLFENRDKNIVERVMSNLRSADASLSSVIESNNDRKNLVLVLNGMKDFNLNIEIMETAKKVLASYGYSEDFFSDITKAYTIAKIFIERNYVLHEEQFLKEFEEDLIPNDSLHEFISSNIFRDDVFNRVNNVYEKINGTRIRWDEGITASEVIGKLNERLCGDNGEFNKILILFDEFGRYIEFAADRPELAGDSALQQIFETIQDGNNNIIFVAFVQSDLKTYMARVNKSSSIARYVGRYESGEKLYLSSNLETIFANLVKEKDKQMYNDYILDNLQSSENTRKYSELFKDIKNWSMYASTKGVWKEKKKFFGVLVHGIYPMNPLSVLLLTSLSDWYQQRSALNFFMDSIKKIGDKSIEKLAVLPEIFATDIIEGELFTELLLAEKEGRQRSENCIMFERILTKHGEKFNDKQRRTLSSILVFKLLRLSVNSKEELLRALSSLSGSGIQTIVDSLGILENSVGVIVYDENRNVYDFVEDATGENDFRALFSRVRNRLDYITMESLITGEVKKKLGLLSDMQTDFGKINSIRTNEWTYKQEFRTTEELDRSYFKSLIEDIKNSTQVTSARGVFINVYLSDENSYTDVVDLYNEYKIDKYPVVMWLLDDNDGMLYKTLLNEKIVSKFTKEETMKFRRFIDRFLDSNDIDMKQTFKALQAKRELIASEGITKTDKRMKILLNERFKVLYPDIIPFPFEGFTNKQLSIPKKNLSLIAKSMIADAIDYSWIQLQDKKMRNIVSSVFVNPIVGWGVLNKNYEMQYPSNRNLNKLFSELDKHFYSDAKILLSTIYRKCVSAPIGLNDYSFALLLSVYLRLKGVEAKILYKEQVIKNSEWSNIFYKDKFIDLKVLEYSNIIKVNIEGYLKKYQVLCNEIENETNLSRFSALKQKLETLELENDPPESLFEKVQASHMRLDIGLNQLKGFQNKIVSIQGDFYKGTTDGLDFKYLLTAMVKGKELVEAEEHDTGSFAIPSDEIAKIEELFDKGKKIIEDKYMNYIKQQKCMSVSNVGPYRKWLERIASNLRKLGYDKYAVETLEYMEETTGDLKRIRRVQEAVEKCDTFLKVTRPTKYSTQEELLNYQNEGNQLLELIEQNKIMDARTKKNYQSDLRATLEQIESHLESITGQITQIYDRAFTIKSFNDVKEVRELINDLLERGIRHDEKEYITSIGRALTTCIYDINEINANNSLAHRIARVDELKLKYEQYSEDVDLVDMFENYKLEIEKEINKENEFWMETRKLSTDEILSNWNAQECQSYLMSTESLPDFLLEKNVEIINSYRDRVMIRMKDLRVESVIELFKALDKYEKVECIELLKSYINN